MYTTLLAQLEVTRKAIVENVLNQKRNLLLTLGTLQKVNRKIETVIHGIPRKEREFVGIKRQQAIKESLYLLLLQKREETALSYAAAVSDSRIIDTPHVSTQPVKPNRQLVFLLAILVSIVIPIGVVNLLFLINNKVSNRVDIEDKTNTPVLAEIGMKEKGMESVIDMNGKSIISEQFRMFRTNLQFTGEM
jgi:uncharacterized protein involved in exopolysaccharide biosynthesis